MRDIKNLNPNEILKKIINDPYKDLPGRTYIILGKSGPTGKTWLWNELKKLGLNAIEISEEINFLVSYEDGQNHYLEGRFDNTVIVLNKDIKRGIYKTEEIVDEQYYIE